MRPVVIDAEVLERWIRDIEQYDHTCRPHGSCDAARMVLMAKKEAYENVLKIAAPAGSSATMP